MESARRSFAFWRRTLWVLGFVVSAMGSGPAQAEDGPRLLVVPYEVLQPDLRKERLGPKTTDLVVTELQYGGLEVQPWPTGPDTSSLNRGSSASSPEQQARLFLRKGRAAMEQDDLPMALSQLGLATSVLEADAASVSDLRILAEAQFQLAIAQFRDGREGEAEASLQKAAHFDPERRITEDEYPPIFVRAFEGARKAILSRARGRIEVQAPAGSQVFLDGRLMGQAPLLLAQVLPGQHWVRIESSGAHFEVKTVEVSAQQELRLSFSTREHGSTPEAIARALALNRLESQHLSALAEIGARNDARFVLVGVIFATDTAFHLRSGLYDVETSQVGRASDVEFDLDLLSAKVEVFSLAADIRAQLLERQLSSPEVDTPWVPAPDFGGAGQEHRPGQIRTVLAAPPAEEESLAAPAPLRGVVRPKSKLVPKDEMAPIAQPLGTSLALDDPRHAGLRDDGDDLWWVWVLVGVAAVGVGTAATVAVMSNQEPEQGSLQIRW